MENLPIIRLGRDSILLAVESWSLAGKHPAFQFEAKWLLQGGFLNLVMEKHIKRSYAYQLTRILEFLKIIRDWKILL